MGRSPAQRRGPGQALGHLGATTVAGTPAGGGHDELLRRLLGQGGRESKSKVSLDLPDLADVGFIYEADDEKPVDGDVLRFVADEDSPYGGWWMPGAAPGGETMVLVTHSDAGGFDETGYYEWETPAFLVPPATFQLVLVTVDVAISDTGLGDAMTADGLSSITVGFPTPWKVRATDTTNAVHFYGNGTGSCSTTFPMWLHNDTDSETSMTVTFEVRGVATSFVNDGYDATVTARVDTLVPAP